MMRRMNFLVGPLILIVIFVLVTFFLGFVVNDLKSAQPAVVHLNTEVNGSKERDGDVTRSDKYVTVETPVHGKESFTWSQVEYITEKDTSGGRKLDRIVELIDLWSKLGIAATLVFFMVGLYQYRHTQKWEREKFLSAEVKDFIERKKNGAAMYMIDSLALYKKGRMIELFPENELASTRKVFVTNDEIYAALTTTADEDLAETDIRAVAIRDCFDSFLSYMLTFYHYIQQDLITADALAAHIGYWFELLGPNGKLAPKYKKRIFAYATNFEMTDFELLVMKYNKPPIRERILGWFIK